MFRFFCLTALLVASVTQNMWGQQPADQQAMRNKWRKEMNEGNFRDAYEGFRTLALDAKCDPRVVGEDLRMATDCLQRLNRTNEIDDFREAVIAVHKDNWRLLWAAARNYMEVEHQGFMIAGKFERGPHRGGGKVVNAIERDRVRALQLLVQALPKARQDDNRSEAAQMLLYLAEVLLNQRGHSEAWRLQYLTDLSVLPDYEEGWGYFRDAVGAPVDAEGKPVFHYTPKSFEDAKTDGERWRWCLEQAVEMNPGLLNQVRFHFAQFLLSQFGVETLAHYGWRFGEVGEESQDETGTYALHTLGENETIARLATGVKRFELPDEFNYIRIFQKIAAEPKTGFAQQSLEQLAQIFENRRQYPKAAEHWRRLLKEFPNVLQHQRNHWQQRLDQIVGNWGRFENVQVAPAGKGATVEFRFRNGQEVEFTAHEIDIKKLLDDVKEYLKSNPKQLDWERVNIGDIGHRLVQRNEEKYRGPQVAQWKMLLRPRANHFDKRVTVTTPLQKPGAYLVTAKMAGGNTSFIVLWVSDTVIARKPMEGKMLYYVADSVTGKPVAKANVEFFGWKTVYHDKPPRHEVVSRQFAEFTDADGQLLLGPDRLSPEYRWLIIARTEDGRFAHLGFTGVWYSQRHDAEYKALKVFAITDRPVYRPEQTVKYKFWARHAQYDQEDTSPTAGKTFYLEIYNPKGEKVESKQFTADQWGGFEGELKLPADATLGVYRMQVYGHTGLGPGGREVMPMPGQIGPPGREVMPMPAPIGPVRGRVMREGPDSVVVAQAAPEVAPAGEPGAEPVADGPAAPGGPGKVGKILKGIKEALIPPNYVPLGGGHFRVEEYKKPEFEVTIDAPAEPVMLGEKVEAVIKAQYYFGAPVTNAKVKYKVLRTSHTERWYPICPWDWFYGPGYWWFAYDYWWYPGFKDWGHPRPIPFWWPRMPMPPELVAEHEAMIGPDGTLKVQIDTAVAKAIHPNQDHSYQITAEVVDQSRRTIVGQGSVLVARKPFSVYGWVDRGYYRVGDTIAAHFSARRLDGKPVQGKGVLQLLRISYPNLKGRPKETPVQTWQVDTNEEGFAAQQIRASQAGQYRLSYKVTDSKGHTIEGGYVFTIIGEGFDSAQFRFNSIELVPDKREYAPGDKVRLQINTDRTGGTVLLFVRPTNGVYLPPKVLRLDGKSTLEQIEVVKRDMPNFFVEAMTVADGKVHTEVREIVVPPEKRILNVEIEPSAQAYKPGQKAKVKLKLTELNGEAYSGSAVVSIYDKSVEYISGGTNVPEIKEFFWKWRRHHHPHTEHNLAWWFGNLTRPKDLPMSDLGIFGHTVAEEMDEVMELGDAGPQGGRFAGKGGGGAFAARAMTAQPSGRMAQAAEGAAAPSMAPGAPMPQADVGMAEQDKSAPAGGDAGAPAMVQPTVRKQFADTAFWNGAITTAKDGTAEIELDMPENLTTWRIKVWGMGHGTKVGQGQTDVVTRKDLIVRLQAPRFFVQKDEVVLSANVHNYLKNKKAVEVVLELEGGTLQALDQLSQKVEIEANGEKRVDWRVRVLEEGQAVVRMKALTDEESDAMEMKFPCYVHGMLKMDCYSGVIRPEQQSGKFTVTVPAQRRPKQSRLEVRYSPTIAGAMVDALPYLVDYPYGCTEQTLNRFLPTVITQKVLLDMGLNLEEIRKKQANLNPQELGEDTERAKQWKRYDRNPVFDEDEVRKMVREGVQRLTEMQCSDGGWGWFSGWGEHSTAHTTALVVHGLQIARQCDVALVPGMLERGIQWLKRYQDEQVQLIKNAELKDKPPHLRWKPHADNLDAFVYMVLVDEGIKNPDMHQFLYRDRLKLSVYCMAMYGLSCHKLDDKEKLEMILRNINQYVQQDDENQTAWLNLPDGFWWYWYGSEYEAHAYYLKLLARTDPKGELASRLVKYLLNNRKHATYWNSTRDTALCVEAFADYLRGSGEHKPEMTVEVYYNGRLQKAVEITPKNLFAFDNKFVLEGEAVAPGKHQVELRRKGAGPLYYNGYMTNFTLEDFITKAGLEIKVERKYYRLKRVEKTEKVAGSRGQVVDQKVEKYVREEIPNLATLKSGELCEIELEIQSKNDYEYLVFEDPKPAGFEPVDLRSGYTGNELGAYVEFRDNRVVMFVRALARGKHSVSYRMRAEIPGQFSALPTRAWAMYAPELKANSDEIKLKIED